MPHLEVKYDDDGNEVRVFGYVKCNTDYSMSLCNANDMTLQAQFDAGVKLDEVPPITPNPLDTARSAIRSTLEIINNPNSFKSPEE